MHDDLMYTQHKSPCNLKCIVNSLLCMDVKFVIDHLESVLTIDHCIFHKQLLFSFYERRVLQLLKVFKPTVIGSLFY